jgi:hypothetical protein
MKMNRKIALLNLLLAFGISVFGQVTLRPYVGLNSPTMTKELLDESEFESNFGFQAGIDVQFGEKVYVQPGLQIEALSNTKVFLPDAAPGLSSFDIKRTYLRIPLMVGYHFGNDESFFDIRLFTGPNAAFKVGGSVSSADGVIKDLNIDEELSNLILGWNGGVGIDFLSIFFVDIGYQIGLSDVFKETEGLNSGVRNNVFYANGGLKFRL